MVSYALRPEEDLLWSDFLELDKTTFGQVKVLFTSLLSAVKFIGLLAMLYSFVSSLSLYQALYLQ